MSLTGFSRTLRWSNFTEKTTSPSPPADAATFSGFKHDRSRVEKTPGKKFRIARASWRVSVTMDTRQSWVVRGKKTADLLKHEQGHYDISAVAAREFHDEALALEADTPEELAAAVEQLLQDKMNKLDALQTMYDEDQTCGTNHSQDAHWQGQWNLRLSTTKTKADGKMADLNTCPSPPPPP